MTLGIEPTRPASVYGYIRRGAPIPEAPGAARVEKFVEKPDRAGAEALIADGALWNSGYFLFRADLMLAELEAFVDEARRVGIAPDTRIRVTAGFRSQIKAIRTYGPQDAQTDAFIDVFAPKGGGA